MKRIIRNAVRRIVFVCVFATLVVLSGCSQEKEIITEEPIAEEPIAVVSSEVVRAMPYIYPINDGVSLSFDPQVELLFLAADYLSDESQHYLGDSGYIKEARKLFEASNEDDLFRLLDQLLDNGFKYSQMTSVLNRYDVDYKLKASIDLTGYTMLQRSYLEIEEDLIWLMKKYREQSNFDSFFMSYETLYNKQLKLAGQRITRTKVFERMEAFFGRPLENITIAFTPNAINAQIATHPLKDGNYDTLVTMPVADRDIEFITVLIHELSHRYIDVVTQKNQSLVAKSEWHFKPFELPQLNEIYSNWNLVYNEYMVRAVTCIIIGEIYGDGEMKKQIDSEVLDGFSDIDDAIKLFIAYKANRKEYKTFQDFSTILMEQFAVQEQSK